MNSDRDSEKVYTCKFHEDGDLYVLFIPGLVYGRSSGNTCRMNE